ncbi:MAG: DUF3035 domain-containing protein [Rhodospirillales bacterium]|nr:DUF3035 domain-containing protein [Rhodospirillales bacterium]
MKTFKVIFLTGFALAALSACESAKDQLGLTKEAPDEFKVVKHAPLEMPPSYTLRPPQPGAPRPQEQAMVDEARDTVLGEGASQADSPSSGSESVLLQAAGATQADPNIRAKVDEESANMVDENQPVIDKLMNLGRDTPPPASVVDAKKESERLQQNQIEGKPVTEGETPSLDD